MNEEMKNELDPKDLEGVTGGIKPMRGKKTDPFKVIREHYHQQILEQQQQQQQQQQH